MLEDIILKILGFVIVGFFIVLFIGGVVIDSIIGHIKIKKKNLQFLKENDMHGMKRMRCLDCKYCRKYTHHSFYKHGSLSNAYVSTHPEYCRRFKVSLKMENRDLRCITPLHEQAMWEKEP